MNHLLILPILLPAVVGALLVLAARHDSVLARSFAVASTVLMLGIAVALLVLASDGQVRSYALGAWPAAAVVPPASSGGQGASTKVLYFASVKAPLM